MLPAAYQVTPPSDLFRHAESGVVKGLIAAPPETITTAREFGAA